MSTTPPIELVGQIVAGKFAELLIRQKAEKTIELGDLLIADDPTGYQILQVYDLKYASQIPDKSQELISGLKLEGMGADLQIFEPQLRNYVIATTKSLVHIKRNEKFTDIVLPKTLPTFFKEIRQICPTDLTFLTKPTHPIYLGKVRSGSKLLDFDIYLNGHDMITHHTLIAATTGRGKSNFMKTMLWHRLDEEDIGMLILDPHDEYFGRTAVGLKDHPNASANLVYYSPITVSGHITSKTLLINIDSIFPQDLIGCIDLTDAQEQSMSICYQNFNNDWINQMITMNEDTMNALNLKPGTMAVLRRKFSSLLGIHDNHGMLSITNRAFVQGVAGQSTLNSILDEVEKGKVVIIDTSQLHDSIELLIGTMLSRNMLNRYQKAKFEGILQEKKPVGIVLEEAPRVLSKDVLEGGENIYSRIAKEGRKFKVGLIAITQLTSIIPTTILANMNTKIILGNENKPERQAIINSACQDLSEDDRTIASLDKGEAIISSTFSRFAVPVKFPLFEDFVKEKLTQVKTSKKKKAVEM